jgi:hypothetical protein
MKKRRLNPVAVENPLSGVDSKRLILGIKQRVRICFEIKYFANAVTLCHIRLHGRTALSSDFASLSAG